MIARRPELFWSAATLGLAFGLFSGLADVVRAQHTPDPYNIVGDYNNQYEPYVYNSYPNSPGQLPNQARLQGRTGVRNSNAFQSFLDSEGDELADFGRGVMPRQSGPGTPYYRAYRRFDQEFQRNYRPNEAADRSYYNDQQHRNDKYFQALREPDSRKRAQLLREYNLDNMRAAKDLSGGRNSPERDREALRDRFSGGGSSLFQDDPENDEGNKTFSNAPPPRRPLGGPAPSTASPARGRNGVSSSSTGGNLSRPTGRSARPPASLSPPYSGRNSAPSASELLDRSELMDRASRVTAPVIPRSSAPSR